MNELISCRATANLIGMPARTFLRWVGDDYLHPECVMVPPKGNKRIRITKLIYHHPGCRHKNNVITLEIWQSSNHILTWIFTLLGLNVAQFGKRMDVFKISLMACAGHGTTPRSENVSGLNSQQGFTSKQTSLLKSSPPEKNSIGFVLLTSLKWLLPNTSFRK